MAFAVVFKAYQWDPFIHRQALRCAAAAAGGDFHISIDETAGSFGALPFENVSRTSTADLIAAGFADRYEKGSLIWWNPDYVHYRFAEQHPDYDYYVFVEYDAVIGGSVAPMVAQAEAGGIDLVTLPIASPARDWFWGLYHRQTYRRADLHGSLVCISIFSRHALQVLARRRREMAREGVAYWPSSEAFLPTEARLAGLRQASLAEFGDVSGYAAFPPMLEEDLRAHPEAAFLHPVLTPERYAASLLKSTPTVGSFFNPRSELMRLLARVPPRSYRGGLAAAALRRMRAILLERIERGRLRLRPGLLRP